MAEHRPSRPPKPDVVFPVFFRVLPAAAIGLALLCAGLVDLPHEFAKGLIYGMPVLGFMAFYFIPSEFPVKWLLKATRLLLVATSTIYFMGEIGGMDRGLWTATHLLSVLTWIGVAVISAHPTVAHGASMAAIFALACVVVGLFITLAFWAKDWLAQNF